MVWSSDSPDPSTALEPRSEERAKKNCPSISPRGREALERLRVNPEAQGSRRVDGKTYCFIHIDT